MQIRRPLSWLACLSIVALAACFEDPAANNNNNNNDDNGNDSTTGDGDGDPSGDGDGDPSGDGDGDGDGDPTGDGDGDGDGDSCDACGPLQLCHALTCVPAAQVLYLNFDAEGDFSYSSDQPADARINRHDISADFVGDALPGFSGDAFARQQLLDRVRADFAGLRVVITDERPPEGDYSMIVFTEHVSQHPNVVALPSNDCGDQNPNDVAFMFFNLAGLNHQQRANFVSASLAQFAGLEPLSHEDADNKADIMYPFLNETDPSFTDECRALPGEILCELNHMLHCDGKGMQNSWAEIDALWGF